MTITRLILLVMAVVVVLGVRIFFGREADPESINCDFFTRRRGLWVPLHGDTSTPPTGECWLA